MISGFNGGIINSILLGIFFLSSCNDMRKVKFEDNWESINHTVIQTLSLKMINAKDSSVYIYIGKYDDDDDELFKLKYVIYHQKGLLHVYDDKKLIIKGKFDCNKKIVVKNKNIIIEAYGSEEPGFGDLLYYLFTKEYGLIFVKVVGGERKLVKFNKKESEIRELINAIKEDSVFYKWGGREPIYPPND